MNNGIVIDEIGGNCPVQAEGTIDGKAFYFRARGEHWAIEIGGPLSGNPDFYYEEEYGNGPFDAGWMKEKEARKFINKGADLYRASK